MQQLEVKRGETHFLSAVTGASSMKADHHTQPLQPCGCVQQFTDAATKSPHAEKQSTPGHNLHISYIPEPDRCFHAG